MGKKKKTTSITEKFVATIAILLTCNSGAYQRLLTLKYFLWSMRKQNASMLSRRDFGRRDSKIPARILARFKARSRRDFGRREFRSPARIFSRPGNPGGQNLAGIPPRSRSLFYKGKYFTSYHGISRLFQI